MNIKDNLFLYRLKLLDYKTELIIAFLTFTGSYLIFSKYSSVLGLREEYMPLWSGALRLAVWIFLFLLIKNLWDWQSPYIVNVFKKRIYELKSADWPKKWIFQGGIKTESSPSALVIKNSNSGCLLKELWRNFEMSFEMKFAPMPENTLGILFRAESLENYFMLQIKYKQNENFSITPHIRWFGNWDVFMNEKPLFVFKREDYFDKFFQVKLLVQGVVAKLFFEEKLAYEWILPSHVEARYKQHEQNMDKEETKKVKSGVNVVKIPFREHHGMIGFRAYPYTEEATIRDLQIKAL